MYSIDFHGNSIQAKSVHKKTRNHNRIEPRTLRHFPATEGQYMVIDGVKRRHGTGTHANGKEKYVGEWLNDSMHGEGSTRRVPDSIYC